MATGSYFIGEIQSSIGDILTPYYTVEPQSFSSSISGNNVSIGEPARNGNYSSYNMPALQGSAALQISLRNDGPKGIWANAPITGDPWSDAVTIFSYADIDVKAARDSAGFYYIFFYNRETHGNLASFNLSNIGSTTAYTLVFLSIIDGDNEYILPYWIEGNAFWFGHQGTTTYNLAHYSAPAPVIQHSWKSWQQLSGNAGMFLMDLSTIDDALIGDGQTPYETFDPAGFNISPQSELYQLVSNLLNGQESKIVFCGDNYITATRRSTFVNDVLTVYVTLKFYFRSDTLIYTSPELTIYSDNTEISRDYLSIIYDEENEVAAPNIIQVWASGKYGINEYALPSAEQMRALYIWLQDNGAYRERVSPYDTGTTDNGGNPGVPAPQDHITDTDPPTLSGLNNGIVTLYRPTEEQLTQISAFLWSDNVLDNFKKYFNNFADNLLNLYILPYTPAGLNTKTFKVGNMVSSITDVEFCTQRFHDIPMGSVNIEKLWDCYLDFAPYTKLEIYLPYLGMHSLDIDEFMCPTKMDGTLQRGLGSVLSLTYRLDILTGVIVAKVKLNGDVRYQFEGKVGANIPLTGQTYASMVQGIVTAGAGLISTIATGGLTAPMSAAAAVAGTVNAAKPSVERVGNISGDASMLCTNEPYIVISRPNKPKLINQARYTGFPSYKTDTIGNFEGFTQVIDAHIDGISCTEEERAMILSLLKEGVIL